MCGCGDAGVRVAKAILTFRFEQKPVKSIMETVAVNRGLHCCIEATWLFRRAAGSGEGHPLF